MPKKVSYKSFKDCLENFEENVDPNMGIYDFEKMQDNFSIYACFNAYSDFKKKYSRVPKNWNKDDMVEFCEFVKKIALQNKKSEEDIEKISEFAKAFSCIAEAELPSIGAYLGGLASQ